MFLARFTDVKKENCPNRAQHTKCPEGYLQWHAWAEGMGKTHRVKRCPGCELWVIWVPKKRRKGAR